ncbi:MAG: tetratricopeptide repeat protein [Bacteroidetes bacterium]|jgi:tetratricopeptide (TPR) repeat protein|nr:tetratricopeptide repeat protein [Bacteroidota bacterium]
MKRIFWLLLLALPAYLWAQRDCNALPGTVAAQVAAADSLAGEPKQAQYSQIWHCLLPKIKHLDYEKLDSLDKLAVLQLRNELGASQLRQANYREASHWLLPRPDMPETDTLSLAYAVLLHNRAVLYQQTERCAEAIPVYRRALNIKLKTLGNEWHLTVAETFNNLGQCYLEQQDYETAAYTFMRAGGILVEKRGPKDIDVANVSLSLGRAQMLMEEYARAEATYKAALHVLDGYQPTEQVLILAGRAARGLAGALLKQGKEQDAIKVLGILLEDFEAQAATVPAQEVVEAWRLLGHCFEQQQLYQQAADSYTRAYARMQETGQPIPPAMAYDVGRMRLLLLDYNQADRWLWEATEGKDLAVTQEALKALKLLYEATGNTRQLQKVTRMQARL